MSDENKLPLALFDDVDVSGITESILSPDLTRKILANRIINEKLSGLLGPDITDIAPQLQETITPEELSASLVNELGADGVRMAIRIGLPMTAEIASRHGIEYVELPVEEFNINNVKGFPTTSV